MRRSTSGPRDQVRTMLAVRIGLAGLSTFVSFILVLSATPLLADTARSSSGRVGYRSHGHYARPKPPPPPVSTTGAYGAIRDIGIFGTGHQGAAGVQRPFYSTTSPRRADPNYPGGVAPVLPGGVPGRTFVYFGNPFPYTERVVYVPVEAERSEPERRSRNSEPAGNPIYIVVQPGAEVEVGSEPLVPAGPPVQAAERVERDRERRPKAPGELFLSILPMDAEVFLDDRFLGTGADLGDLGREVSAGVHVLDVVHADHRRERLFFGVPDGGTAAVEVDLADTNSRRRSRLETSP